MSPTVPRPCVYWVCLYSPCRSLRQQGEPDHPMVSFLIAWREYKSGKENVIVV